MDGTEVSVLKKAYNVGFRRLLKRKHRTGLEPEVGLKLLSDFSHKSLEGEFSHEKVSRLLVLSNFSESNGSGLESVRLLYSSTPLEGEDFLAALLATFFLSVLPLVFFLAVCLVLAID
jgi:hypothetical protein